MKIMVRVSFSHKRKRSRKTVRTAILTALFVLWL